MMEDWEEVKIKDVSKIIGGYAFKSKDFKENGQIPIIKIKSLKDRNLVIEEGDFIDESFLQLDKKFHIKYNDILIALTGSHITLPSSAVGRVAKSRHHQTLLLNQRVGKFLVDTNVCDHDFFYYMLITDYFFQSIGLRAKGAANQANISGGDVGDIKINLPPLPTQRKIASILSAYDDLIENNLKRIKLLEEIAQLTYEEWFTRMKFPGYETTPINEETGLPEGWEKKKIVNFNSLSQYKKKVTKFEDEIEYLATANVDGIAITERGEMVNWDNKPSRAQILPPKESVWFARMSNTYKVLHFTKQTINNVLLSSGFAGFIPKNSNCLAFLFCMIKSEKFDLQKNMYASGSTQVSLNNQGLSLMNEIEPSLELIEKFGEICLNNLEEIHVLYNQNQLLKEARDILLPRLMTAMIDVEKMKLENLQPTTA